MSHNIPCLEVIERCTHPAMSMDNMQNLMTTFLVLFVSLMYSLLSRFDSDHLLRLDSLHFLLHQVRVE